MLQLGLFSVIIICSVRHVPLFCSLYPNLAPFSMFQNYSVLPCSNIMLFSMFHYYAYAIHFSKSISCFQDHWLLISVVPCCRGKCWLDLNQHSKPFGANNLSLIRWKMLIAVSKLISSIFISPPKLGDSIFIAHDRLQVEFAKTACSRMQRRRRAGKIFSTGPLDRFCFWVVAITIQLFVSFIQMQFFNSIFWLLFYQCYGPRS